MFVFSLRDMVFRVVPCDFAEDQAVIVQMGPGEQFRSGPLICSLPDSHLIWHNLICMLIDVSPVLVMAVTKCRRFEDVDRHGRDLSSM